MDDDQRTYEPMKAILDPSEPRKQRVKEQCVQHNFVVDACWWVLIKSWVLCMAERRSTGQLALYFLKAV